MVFRVCLRLAIGSTPKAPAAECTPITAFSLGYRARRLAKWSYQEGPRR